jgi:hypothetical protein
LRINEADLHGFGDGRSSAQGFSDSGLYSYGGGTLSLSSAVGQSSLDEIEAARRREGVWRFGEKAKQWSQELLLKARDSRKPQK